MAAYLKANQRRLAPWLFLAPGLLMFAVYVVIPIFRSMAISFYDWDGLGVAEYIGAANYIELIDDDALIAALESGRIGAAGLDVFTGEPAFDARYAALPNTFLLPHLGSATTETRTAMGLRALANADAFFGGHEMPDRVV